MANVFRYNNLSGTKGKSDFLNSMSGLEPFTLVGFALMRWVCVYVYEHLLTT